MEFLECVAHTESRRRPYSHKNLNRYIENRTQLNVQHQKTTWK